MANVGYIQNWRAGRLKFSHLILVACLFSAAFLLYLPSELGAALTIPPDSSEYSICLVNLFEHGKFGFTLNGEWYPSRYSPWFSLTCLTPAYLLSGGNPLCFHWAILAFSLVLLVLIFEFGRRVGLGWAAPVPPLLLMFLPDFVFYSRVVMTEIPYTALLAVNTLLFARFAAARNHSRRLCLVAGALVAWLGMVRVTGIPMILAFVAVLVVKRESWRSAIKRILLVVLPSSAYILGNLSYNRVVFGNFFRSGYNYWVSVPCDFPKITFNMDNAGTVAYMLTHETIGLFMIATVFLTLAFWLSVILGRFGGVRGNGWFVAATSYLFLQTLALALLYGGYYWADTRFFLPITICFLPLAIFAVMTILSACCGFHLRIPLTVAVIVLCLVVVVRARTRYLYMAEGRPIWLAEAQIASAVLPPGSVVLQQGDPNVLDHFGFRDRGIRLFPIRRDFDYVKHMTAPRRINHLVDAPESVEQTILPALVSSGVCGLPFPFVAEERPEVIRDFLSRGCRVFLLQSHFYGKKYFEEFKSRVEGMGLVLKLFGVWNVPCIAPSPVRHLYDRLLFPDCSMDLRPEITAVYYEIVPGGASLGEGPAKRRGETDDDDFCRGSVL